MLKGLILAAAAPEDWKEQRKREGLLLEETEGKTPADFQKALALLHLEKDEVLCLVETDREERIARELGLFCLGYLNPDCPDEQLSGCRLLLEGFEEVDRQLLEQVHTRALGLPVQIAETRRLLIREMTLADLDEIHTLYQEEPTALFDPAPAVSRQEEERQMQAYIDYMYGMYQFGMWVVIEKASGRLIGRAGFGIADYLDFSEIDLGYLIGKAYRGKGYAREACRAVLEYGTKVLELPRISAYIEEENIPSLRLIEKLGFRREREFICQGKVLYRYLKDNL